MWQDRKEMISKSALFFVVVEFCVAAKLGEFKKLSETVSAESPLIALLAYIMCGIGLTFIAYLIGWAAFCSVCSKDVFENEKEYSKALNWSCTLFAKIAAGIYVGMLILVIIF